jgi:hypothetical protein
VLLATTIIIAFWTLAAPAPAFGAGSVTLNGVPIPKATSALSIAADVTEYREGGELCPRLLKQCPKIGVCLTAPAPVSELDAEVAGAGSATRFTVGIEDGRELVRCLVTSLTADGSGARRRWTYCLRCEGSTAPPS